MVRWGHRTSNIRTEKNDAVNRANYQTVQVFAYEKKVCFLILIPSSNTFHTLSIQANLRHCSLYKGCDSLFPVYKKNPIGVHLDFLHNAKSPLRSVAYH